MGELQIRAKIDTNETETKSETDLELIEELFRINYNCVTISLSKADVVNLAFLVEKPEALKELLIVLEKNNRTCIAVQRDAKFGLYILAQPYVSANRPGIIEDCNLEYEFKGVILRPLKIKCENQFDLARIFCMLCPAVGSNPDSIIKYLQKRQEEKVMYRTLEDQRKIQSASIELAITLATTRQIS